MNSIIKVSIFLVILHHTQGENVETSGTDVLHKVQQTVLDYDNTFTITTFKDVYEEKYCVIKRREYWNHTSEGTIDDNSVVYDSITSFELIGQLTIAPGPNLQGFQVNFGANNFTDGIQFGFTTEDLYCRQGKAIDQGKIVGKFCASVTQLKRMPSAVQGCITIVGVKLSATDYDINTINKFNNIKVLAIDMGCYTATANSIQYNVNNANVLNKTLDTIVNQINLEVCGACQHVANFIVIVTVAILLIKFSQN